MATIENELWNVFTFYSLHGNPLDPEHMRKSQFLKLCRECQMLRGNRIVAALLDVIYTTEVNKRINENKLHPTKSTNDNINLMIFSDFLNAILRISGKIYPNLDCDSSFQKILLENILPLAGRRRPIQIDYLDRDQDVNMVFMRFRRAIDDIFSWYGKLADNRRKIEQARKVRSTKETNKYGLLFLANKGTSGGNKSKYTKENGKIGFKEYTQFCQDFMFNSSACLTSVELGDIYLSSISMSTNDNLRAMGKDEFYDSLKRISILAFPYTDVSITAADKMKGIFLFMWRVINRKDKAAEAVHKRSRCESVKGNGGDLNICGSAQLNVIMLEQWKMDNFRDYLTPTEKLEEAGRDVLKRIIRKSKTSDLLDDNNNFDMMVTDVDDSSESDEKVKVTGKQLRDLITQRPEIADILYEGIKDLDVHG